MTSHLEYAFCYCEENVYKFLESIYTKSDLFDRSCAVFMTSFSCRPCDEVLNSWTSLVPYRPYESSEFRKDLTVWDYHVIALVRSTHSGKWYVVDQDSKLPPTEDTELGPLAPRCVDLHRYVTQVLFLDAAASGLVCSELTELLNRVRYRVIERDDYLSLLRSDRSHMQKAPGMYRAKPPPWPPVSESSASVGYEAKKRAEAVLSALPPNLRVNNLACFINAASTSIPGVIMDRHSFEEFFH
ncbi:hypothetical protein LSCM1_01955 [Leishmania martiniquensis]|uniref:Protein N-terminal glutamine amidohydrolase n=1 Tax=Leishmania martiniquensis TaxID=1580590 RepID=A0A836GEJ7_9TRYP|nr:hypothetical protein LSCM1_01955 [Leishmania martiniquensis]